ncbi:MAG: type I 3-dehydroquinate dehydratase [Deltaproteobacteria bacterium]|nr:type I 3-dehydroquinate dehydratase [Deltaproteobacteria bacterium]
MLKKKRAWPLKTPAVAGVIVDGVKKGTLKKTLLNGADCLEVRVDTFAVRDLDALKEGVGRLKESAGVPLIITVRSRKEGGGRSMPDNRRAEIFKALMPFAGIVDIELSSSGGLLKDVIDCAKRSGKGVIVSYHNFKTTPGIDTLDALIKKARSSGADVVKIAAFARGTKDLRRLAGVLAGSDDLIVIAMGRYGAFTRIFFPMLGSLLTYGSITDGTAPGQLPLKEITGELRRYGFR